MTRAMAREMAAAQARMAAQARPRAASTSRMQGARRFIKRYRPNDHAKRHRLDDEQEKDQVVTSYTRRKA